VIVEKIEAIALRIPFASTDGSDTAAWSGKGAPAADSLLVKVTTSDGLVGWGETFGFGVVPAAKAAIETMIAPLCVGMRADRIAPLMRDIQAKLHIFGRGGPVMYGISALDIALWDVLGKACGVPVHRLLGGARDTTVEAYASLERFTRPDIVHARVRRAVDDGYRHVKLHEVELDSLHAARDAAGPDIGLMLDVNCAWDFETATRRVADLQAIHPRWLEEPLWPPEDAESLARLRRISPLPIAAGENASTIVEFERMLALGAVDVVQPSPAKMGGLTELVKVAALAESRNVTLMIHTFYDGPGLLAAIHATAALGGKDSMVEWRCFDLEANLYANALVPSGGRIAVPQGPGLGLEPDPDVIHDYVVRCDQ
jgi:L-alanine-DL-glutamate epimerase-like enolase superfamily enzyme